jgi:MFS family permease
MSDETPAARGPAPILFGILTLPGGVAQGYISVTLAYVLGHHGVSVAAIAGLEAVMLLPQTWRFVAGPVVDVSLSPKIWTALYVGLTALTMVAFAMTPPAASALPLMGVLALMVGILSATASPASSAMIAQTVPVSRRGAVAGWTQTGNLGGTGLGGGAGLWLVAHAGGLPVAALTLAAVSVVCGAPLLALPAVTRSAGDGVAQQVRGLGRGLWALLRTRQGVLAALVVTIPASLGASSGLLPAVAGEWRASADLVAAVTGLLGGLITIPGCMLGGYLCDRFPRRIVYIGASIAYGISVGAMAFLPHTPAWFAGQILLGSMVLGVAFASVSAVIYECLGRQAAATISAALGSLCNVPVVAVTALLGVVETQHGSGGMLLTEGGLGVLSALAYAALAWAWRPQTVAADAALAAA